MIRRLSVLCLLSSVFCLRAADVRFSLQSFTGRNVNYPLTLTPYAPLAVNGTNLVTSAAFKLTPTNGVAYASNLLAGDYTLTIENTSAKVVITVPDTNVLLEASALVSVAPAAAAGLAYSKTASDARYLRADASDLSLTNVTLWPDVGPQPTFAYDENLIQFYPPAQFLGGISGDGSGLTGIPASAIDGAVSGASIDSSGVPTTLTMQLPMTGRRAFVHPNFVNLSTNLHGYQYWGSVGTGLTTDTAATAFEWPQAMKSHDFVNWEPAGDVPTVNRTNALAFAGMSSVGWVADNETYVAPDGTIQMLFAAFEGVAPYTNKFYSTLMTASSVDGTNWALAVLKRDTNFNGGGLTNYATFAGPQVVRDHTNGLRLYYVDDGQSTLGTNVLKWVPALDESGTNWNWAGETSCTLATFGTRFYAPWHFSMNCVDGTYHMFFGNQGSSWGEYSTSTNGINFSPAGGGVFSTPGLFTGNEFASYKSAFRPVPGPNGLAWDVLLGATPQDQAQTQYVSGWNIKVLRGFQVDTTKLSYTGGNTNWALFGADKNLGSVNRVGALTVSESGLTAGIGSFGGGAALTLGYNAPINSTNYALWADGTSQLRVNTRIGQQLNFAQNNGIVAGFGTGKGLTIGSVPDDSLTTGQLKASVLIASASLVVTNSAAGDTVFRADTSTGVTIGSAYNLSAATISAGQITGTVIGNLAGSSNVNLITATGVLPMGTLTTNTANVTNGFLQFQGEAGRQYTRDLSSGTNLSQILGGGYGMSITDSTEKFFPWFGIITSSGETAVASPIPKAGWLSKAYFVVNQAPGTGTNYTFKIYTNGTFCGLSAVLGSGQFATNDLTTITASLPAGSVVSVGIKSSYNGAHITSYFRWCFLLTN